MRCSFNNAYCIFKATMSKCIKRYTSAICVSNVDRYGVLANWFAPQNLHLARTWQQGLPPRDQCIEPWFPVAQRQYASKLDIALSLHNNKCISVHSHNAIFKLPIKIWLYYLICKKIFIYFEIYRLLDLV